MKNKILLPLFLVISVGILNAQTYFHPTTGLQNTNAGACMVTTCSGTYYDDGGAGGNYSANSWGVYRTFCPSTPNTCIRATFSYLDNNDFSGFWCGGCCDFFAVINGATQNNPFLFGPTCGAGNPGVFTSTDASGCLGFRHWSDGSVTRPGWQITLSCVACGTGPNGTDNNDCEQNTPVCNNLPFNGTSNGPGLTSSCTGCVVSENYSSWYHIRTQTAGSLALTITPTNGTDDYDFALFQSSNCAALGAPVRCSYAAGNAATGMANGWGDFSEDVTGNSWVEDINPVAAGTDFYLLVNDWSGTGGGYTLNWSSSTASLDCSVLPVELLDFVGRPYDGYIELNWNVATELSLNQYEIEKLINGEWQKILERQPEGSNSFYAITDIFPKRGANIYRLKSVDLNGEYSYSKTISVNYEKEMFDIVVTPDKVTIDATDIVIESIELFNVLGQEISNLPLTVKDEGMKYELNLDNLPNNTYIVRVNGVESRLFVKYY